MELLVNNSYILKVESNGVELTYHCRIIEINDNFVTFIDKFGKTISYRKDKIISFEEVQNG